MSFMHVQKEKHYKMKTIWSWNASAYKTFELFQIVKMLNHNVVYDLNLLCSKQFFPQSTVTKIFDPNRHLKYSDATNYWVCTPIHTFIFSHDSYFISTLSTPFYNCFQQFIIVHIFESCHVFNNLYYIFFKVKLKLIFLMETIFFVITSMYCIHILILKLKL